jgi:type IV pilus assembly protein PilZ
MPVTERREEPRAEVDIEVRYRTGQEFLSAYSQNISGGGIFVRTARPLPLNHRVRLRFTLPGVPHRFEVNGIVVWSNPGSGHGSFSSGMGIKLMDLDPYSKKLITEFVKAKSPAAAPEKGRRRA